MKVKKYSFNKIAPLLIISISFIACLNESQTKQETSTTFDESNLLPEGLSKKPEIVNNQIIAAMGGQEKWEELRYISWTFFNTRHLIWDKHNSLVRIESPRDSSIYVLDMKTNRGRYWKDGIEEKNEELLKEKMTRANNIWINDMYWLFMPFKLQDPGTSLAYLKEDSLNGNSCSIFSITFKDVGITPENKYEIAVDHSDHLIKQWTYFEKSEQDTAYATWPWDNYQEYNGLLLSADRSDGKGPSNVRVYKELDQNIFKTFQGIEFY